MPWPIRVTRKGRGKRSGRSGLRPRGRKGVLGRDMRYSPWQIVRRTEKTGAVSCRVMDRVVPAGESEWIVRQLVIERRRVERCRLRRVENHRTDSEGNMAQGPLATPQCSLSPNRAWLFRWLCFGRSVRILGRRLAADRATAEVSAPSLFYSNYFLFLHSSLLYSQI